MPPPPSKPKVPTRGVPLGHGDDEPTKIEPRKLVLPRAPARSGGDGFDTSDVPTNPGRPVFETARWLHHAVAQRRDDEPGQPGLHRRGTGGEAEPLA